MQHEERIPNPGLNYESLNWMGELTLLKATGSTSGGLYSLAEVYVTPEGLVPLHVHHREDEAFYVLEGELRFEVGGSAYEAGPGTFVFGPKDVPHRYEVKSPRARLLMIFSPAGFEGFIRATSTPAESPVPPPPGSVEIDLDLVLARAAEYGAEILD